MKLIRNAEDLAICGAPPAFDSPLHVGRPNIGDRETLFRRWGEMLDRRWLSNNGPFVQQLEKAIAEHLNVQHCIAICNGTVALEVAIRALGLKGEVIVPSYTFVATAHALYWQGVMPVFADIDPLTHNLDPRSVEERITPRTTGIVGVHLWGRPCDTDALDAIGRRHGLAVMYDAAHAFDCSHQGRKVGNFGRCEVLSFHATKFFNTFEGGAVVTNDADLAATVRLMTNFGFAGYDNVIEVGTNGKMTEMAAAMGITGLESIEEFQSINRRNYAQYGASLERIPGLSMIRHNDPQKANCQYVVIEVGPGYGVSRDRLVEILHADNILARIYFWPGCHKMMPYRSLGLDSSFRLTHTERVADRVVVLPTGTAVDEAAIDAITSILAIAPRVR